MSEQSQSCEYANGLAHPNEKRLAVAILSGVEDATITAEIGFDQMQIDNMRERLMNAGCIGRAPEAEEASNAPQEPRTPAEDSGAGVTPDNVPGSENTQGPVEEPGVLGVAGEPQA